MIHFNLRLNLCTTLKPSVRTLAQAHVCNHSCDFPCLSEEASPPPPPAVEICEFDTLEYCDQATKSAMYTCEADFCLSCPQAHSCD